MTTLDEDLERYEGLKTRFVSEVMAYTIFRLTVLLLRITRNN